MKHIVGILIAIAILSTSNLSEARCPAPRRTCASTCISTYLRSKIQNVKRKARKALRHFWRSCKRATCKKRLSPAFKRKVRRLINKITVTETVLRITPRSPKNACVGLLLKRLRTLGKLFRNATVNGAGCVYRYKRFRRSRRFRKTFRYGYRCFTNCLRLKKKKKPCKKKKKRGRTRRRRSRRGRATPAPPRLARGPRPTPLSPSARRRWQYSRPHYVCRDTRDCRLRFPGRRLVRCYRGYCIEPRITLPTPRRSAPSRTSGTCTGDRQCNRNQICVRGRCIPGCRSNRDCSGTNVCSHNRCVPRIAATPSGPRTIPPPVPRATNPPAATAPPSTTVRKTSVNAGINFAGIRIVGRKAHPSEEKTGFKPGERHWEGLDVFADLGLWLTATSWKDWRLLAEVMFGGRYAELARNTPYNLDVRTRFYGSLFFGLDSPRAANLRFQIGFRFTTPTTGGQGDNTGAGNPGDAWGLNTEGYIALKIWKQIGLFAEGRLGAVFGKGLQADATLGATLGGHFTPSFSVIVGAGYNPGINNTTDTDDTNMSQRLALMAGFGIHNKGKRILTVKTTVRLALDSTNWGTTGYQVMFIAVWGSGSKRSTIPNPVLHIKKPDPTTRDKTKSPD